MKKEPKIDFPIVLIGMKEAGKSEVFRAVESLKNFGVRIDNKEVKVEVKLIDTEGDFWE